jgi:hypothetical protein
VSKSTSCIDTRRFRLQAERLRWPKVRRAVRRQRAQAFGALGSKDNDDAFFGRPSPAEQGDGQGGEGVEPLLLVGEG